MTDTTNLDIALIRLDGGTQPRAGLDEATVGAYAEALERGDQLPPIAVMYDGKAYWLFDGFHRVEALKRTGWKQFDAIVESGTQQDAQWRSYSVNAAHGLPRTQADKRRAIRAALLHPQGANKSDREIARHISVDGKTVATVRAELEATAEIRSQATRTGGDGRTINTANIGGEPAADSPSPDLLAVARALWDAHEQTRLQWINLTGVPRGRELVSQTWALEAKNNAFGIRYQITPEGCKAIERDLPAVLRPTAEAPKPSSAPSQPSARTFTLAQITNTKIGALRSAAIPEVKAETTNGRLYIIEPEHIRYHAERNLAEVWMAGIWYAVVQTGIQGWANEENLPWDGVMGEAVTLVPDAPERPSIKQGDTVLYKDGRYEVRAVNANGWMRIGNGRQPISAHIDEVKLVTDYADAPADDDVQPHPDEPSIPADPTTPPYTPPPASEVAALLGKHGVVVRKIALHERNGNAGTYSISLTIPFGAQGDKQTLVGIARSAALRIETLDGWMTLDDGIDIYPGTSAGLGGNGVDTPMVWFAREDHPNLLELDARAAKQRAERAERDAKLAPDLGVNGNGNGSGVRPHSMSVHYSSESDQRYTPLIIAQAVQETFGEQIDLDPASIEIANEVVGAKRIYTFADNGLIQPWDAKNLYTNPPYGDEIGAWIERLVSEYQRGAFPQAIALLPARTDTQWFKRLRRFPRCFIEGRITFRQPDGSDFSSGAPFPSAVFYLGANPDKFIAVFSDLGDVYALVEAKECIR
jgi:hypothetical protein